METNVLNFLKANKQLKLVTAERDVLKQQLGAFNRNKGRWQTEPIRVSSNETELRPNSPGGEEMLAYSVYKGIMADHGHWMGQRLFQGKDCLIFDNIYGCLTRVDMNKIGRGGTVAVDTGTWHAIRALIYAFTKALRLHPILPENTDLRRLRGIGLSGNYMYAPVLERLFDYTNTYFHKEPFLDICSGTLAYSGLDFMISSEIFEHVPPPPDVAFRNCHRMLKPGGILILTVPYGANTTETVEHYPSLYKWELKKKSPAKGTEEDYYIENVNVHGEVEVFPKVHFHGGAGQTVEMRVFSKGHLERLATENGFEIEFVEEDVPLFGIWNQGNMNSLPMILRKL